MIQSVDVIVLSRCTNQEFFNLNQQCINSLIQSEDNIIFNILIIESNKNWESLNFQYNLNNVRVITPTIEFNYNAFLNIGVSECSEDFIVFCNNDLIFKKKWFSEILAVRDYDPSIHSFSPFDPESTYLNKKDFLKDYYIGYRVAIEFVGWCFVLHRIVLERIKKFDESFEFYFQDKDLVETLKKKNIKHALVTKSNVHHIGGMTTGNKNGSFTEQYRKDKNIYLKKWGNDNILRRVFSKFNSLFK